MDSKQRSQLIIGVLLVLVGMAILSRQFGASWALDFGRLWPVVFFVLAAATLAKPDRRLLSADSIWFLFLGTIFLLHTYDVVRLKQSWPLFIVAGGVGLLIETLACQLGRGRAKGSH